MPRRRTLHIHVTRDYDPEEPRKGKGPGGGEWTKGGGGGGGGAAPKRPTKLDLTSSSYQRGRREAQQGRPYKNPFEPGYLHEQFQRGHARGSVEHQGKVALLKGQIGLAGGAGQAGGKPALHIHVHQQTPASEAPGAAAGRVAGKEFVAHNYAQSQDDPSITQETILAKLTPERRQEIEGLLAKAAKAGQTIDKHRDKDKRYSPEREAIHNAILFEGRIGRDDENPTQKKRYPPILGIDQVKNAKPPPGQKPKFVMLGGRGGSGKSWFKGKAYDPKKFIVLDADVIKHQIDEFEGWNAGHVHEESSDVLERALRDARALGLNVVLDATMKSAEGVMDKLKGFKEAGYNIDLEYMHLPRQIAAQRAIDRYFSPAKNDPTGKARGRLVAPEIVLANRLNEENFDKARALADSWAFYDNNVPRGTEPKLIARGGQGG
jgi:predicted ABC-type ATPase